MASLVEGNIRIQNINNKKTIWRIANMLFEDDVWESISDVNRAAAIIRAQKWTSLSKTVFLGIFF